MTELEPWLAELRELERADGFSGVAFVTQGASILLAEAFGEASRAWHVPNRMDTRFDTASVTKLFTAVATLQQIERGAFAIDTKVIPWLGLTGTTISEQVEVRHLLTHTSGIGDDADEEAGESYEAIWQERPSYRVLETADFLPQFAQKPMRFAPGEGCRYNNCAFILLGLMVERASGRDYRAFVMDEVFARVGMTRSGFFRMDRVHEDVAEGCDPIEEGGAKAWKRNIYSYPPIGSPDGGAHVTAPDLERFLRALTRGELLSREMTRDFLLPRALHRENERGRFFYGYGIELCLDSEGNVRYAQKDGINPGVSAILRYYPAHDLCVVLLSNREDGVWRPMRQLAQRIE